MNNMRIFAALAALLTSACVMCSSTDPPPAQDKSVIESASASAKATKAEQYVKPNSGIAKPSVTQKTGQSLSPKKAKDVAQVVLGGTIEKAIPYKDRGGKQRIAVMHRASDRETDYFISVLEEFAGNYRSVWNVEDCCCCFGSPVETFQIADINADGQHEIIYVAEDGGTMTHYSTLTAASPDTKTACTVTSTFNTGATNEEIELSENLLDPAAAKARAWMEGKAAELKIVGAVDIKRADLNDPENAAERWLKENGRLSDGVVKTYWYDGLAAKLYEESVMTGFFHESRTYISTLKGPTYCDDPVKNRHCVVFVPEHLYGWINEIKLEGDELALVSHDEEAVFYFNPKTNALRSVRKVAK